MIDAVVDDGVTRRVTVTTLPAGEVDRDVVAALLIGLEVVILEVGEELVEERLFEVLLDNGVVPIADGARLLIDDTVEPGEAAEFAEAPLFDDTTAPEEATNPDDAPLAEDAAHADEAAHCDDDAHCDDAAH